MNSAEFFAPFFSPYLFLAELRDRFSVAIASVFAISSLSLIAKAERAILIALLYTDYQ